jgi:C-terminal processing protease CtpA/Prc
MRLLQFSRVHISLLSIGFVFLFSTAGVAQQKMDRLDRDRAMSMLKNVKKAIKDDYYDPNFGGMDIEARFVAAEEKLKAAQTLGQAFAIIAQAVVDLNDSHTRFSPPKRNVITDYGWKMKMFGDKCFVTYVKEKSDGESKGLKVGDEVLSVNGFRPARKELWKMIYYYQQLSPQVKVNLAVRSPAGETRQLEVMTKMTQLKAVVDLTNNIDLNEAAREGDKLRSNYKHYFKDLGGIVVWKMPDFAFAPTEVERFMSQVKGKQALVLDLRNNPGGYVVTLEKMAGYFFEKDLKIADLKGRKKMDPQEAKTQGANGFKGKVVVLIDGSSGSAAEIFARLMQLEKRGVVLGDNSAGAVMQSIYHGMDAGSGTVIPYGISITNADVIMSDGKSLEHVGVIPDELILPTGEDLASRRDPVMARALETLGIKIGADEAGKFFPVEKDLDRKSNIALIFEF